MLPLVANAERFRPQAADHSSKVECRDRRLWPFASTSIWNTPIGSGAVYAEANIYRVSEDFDECAAGAADPASRELCPGLSQLFTPN